MVRAASLNRPVVEVHLRIASESVKSKIKELVDAEDPKRPYSDQRLAELLSNHSIVIARRTVTKYREMLRIGSSSERKKHF